jgi:hypothetical protein
MATGCANTGIYHWGNYSDTLYSYTKEPSDASKAKHKTELMHIIEQAQQKKKMVPPGVNFELAMLVADEGRLDEARAYFNQEKELFPESKQYVALALSELEAK